MADRRRATHSRCPISPRSAPRTRASRRYVHRTPVLTCRVARRRGRRAALLQVRELPEGRRVQGARRLQRRVLAGRRRGRDAAWSRTRRAITARRSRTRRAARHSRAGRDAGQRAEGQARQRRAASARRCTSARRRVAAREATCAEVERETGATLVHPLRRRARDRGAGHGGARAARRGAGSRRRSSRRSAAAACCRARPSPRKALRPAIHVLRRRAGERRRCGARASRPARVEPLPHPRRRSPTACARTLSPRTLAALRAHVAIDPHLQRGRIVRAMRLTWERMKIVIEPSSAVPLACLLEAHARRHGRRVGVILTGGNVDLDRLPWQAMTSRASPAHRHHASSWTTRRSRALRARYDMLYDQTLVDRRAELSCAACRAGRRADRAQPDAGRRDAARGGAAAAVVGRLGVGLDNIDVAALRGARHRGDPRHRRQCARRRRIRDRRPRCCCCAAPTRRRAAVAERRRGRARALSDGREIAGKTLGVVGFGGIGRLTAKLARGLGMRVVGFDPRAAGDVAGVGAKRRRAARRSTTLLARGRRGHAARAADRGHART